MVIADLQTGIRCAYCGNYCLNNFSRDHIIPSSKGGVNAQVNKVIACRRCNEDKGDLFLEAWYVKLKKQKFKTRRGRKVNKAIIFRLVEYVKQQGEQLFKSKKCYSLYHEYYKEWNSNNVKIKEGI